MKKIFETSIVNTGGRSGEVYSPDKSFLYEVVSPGVKKDHTTNPEQLFAAAYSACFNGALEMVMDKEKVKSKSSIIATVALYNSPDSGFKIGVRLEIKIDDVSNGDAQVLVEKAHNVCPYSKATRNNIDVELIII